MIVDLRSKLLNSEMEVPMHQTIALVDDDQNILTSVSMALEAEGFRVQSYKDGEEAFQGLSRQPADLAVLDDVHDVVQRQVLVHDDVERHE